MRVSDASLFMKMRQNLSTRQEQLAQAQSHATSGLRVENPSDDPVAFAAAQMQTAAKARAAGHERTVQAAQGMLSVADSALSDVDNLMTYARSMAVQGASDTLNPADRALLAQTVTQLHEQLVSLANTQSGGRYVFGGYKDSTVPFDPTGLYQGDTNAVQVEVSKGVNLPIGVTGDQVFGAAGGQDAFAALTALQTALTANDSAAISSSITLFDASLEQIRAKHSVLGTHLNEADVALAVAQRNQDNATKSVSQLVDADAAAAFSDYARAQSALQAAVAVAAQIPPSLAQRMP